MGSVLSFSFSKSKCSAVRSRERGSGLSHLLCSNRHLRTIINPELRLHHGWENTGIDPNRGLIGPRSDDWHLPQYLAVRPARRTAMNELGKRNQWGEKVREKWAFVSPEKEAVYQGKKQKGGRCKTKQNGMDGLYI